MRGNRAKNSRTEALGLIRNGKGHLLHIVVVTGNIGCMYDSVLYGLIESVKGTGAEDSIETPQSLMEEE